MAKKRFHFLGVEFEVSRNPQTKTQEIKLLLHSRSNRRALDKVKALKEDAVHPAMYQHYLNRWASWWHEVVGLTRQILLTKWVADTKEHEANLVWVGSGLSIGTKRVP